MKHKEIIKRADIPNDECEVCYLHDEAYKKIGKYLICPHCGEKIDGYDYFIPEIDYYMVTEKSINNNLVKDTYYIPVETCPKCSKEIGFKLISIMYNANHDIYYTGSKYYMVDERPKLNKVVKEAIVEYTGEIRNGKSLTALDGIEEEINQILQNFINDYKLKRAIKKTSKDHLLCPHDGKMINEDTLLLEGVMVGEDNSYAEDDEITYMLIARCSDCNDYIGFKPIPVTLDGNDHIYYTDDISYNEDDLPTTNDDIRNSIKQYTERIKNGESLEPWNLEWWINGELGHITANFLYRYGLKE